MSSPVVVSRIQNRRGTQLEFNGHVYSPVGPFSLYPKGYNGDVGYGNFPDFDAIKYPNVLLPGELALCVDTSRMFIGNTDGRYVEIAQEHLGTTMLSPLSWILQPTTSGTNPPNFQPITNLTGSVLKLIPSPFINISYSVTDSGSDNWDTVGQTFSRNGNLTITTISESAVLPIPPINMPPASNVVISDTGASVHVNANYDISFIAQYNNGEIEILYNHNFPNDLTLNTNTLIWVPF